MGRVPQSTALLSVVKSLVDMRQSEERASVVKCEQVAGYFADKMDWIRADLDSGRNGIDLNSLSLHLVLFYGIGLSLLNWTK